MDKELGTSPNATQSITPPRRTEKYTTIGLKL